LMDIPMPVSALNSTLFSYFKDDSNNILHAYALASYVGWCLPLPIPSSKIALPAQKLTSYLTLKLTTHTLPYPKLNKKLTSHMLPFPKNTPVKQCPLLLRSSDGSVVRAPTSTRMVRAATALCARSGTQSAMSSWLEQRWLQWQE
jgi:hypothetical protein